MAGRKLELDRNKIINIHNVDITHQWLYDNRDRRHRQPLLV